MTPSEYISSLFETLLNFQRDGTLCDVVIKARNGAVHAHSVLLAASNAHLCRTLEDQYETTSCDAGGHFVYHLDMINSSLAAIISVLQSVYSGKEFSTVDPECRRTIQMMGFSCSQETSESKTPLMKSSYQLSQSLLELQHDGILCDVTINAGNGSINAHSAILATANPVIRSLFEKQAAENVNKSGHLQYHIDLHDFSLDSIVTSLQSMYVGKVDGIGSMEEKERFLKLTALGFGIPHSGIADTTTCQSSADTRVQSSTASRSHAAVLRKRHQQTIDAGAVQLKCGDTYNARSQSITRGTKIDPLKLQDNFDEVVDEILETSQVTSSDEAISTLNTNNKIREVYDIIHYEKLDEVNSTEINNDKQERLGEDVKTEFDEVYNVVSIADESNIEISSYVLLDSGHEQQDFISSELYIGCATEETVEIQEEELEQTPGAFKNPIIQSRRPKSESILIMPNSASQKSRDIKVDRFGYSNFQSASQNIQSKRGRPAAITVIDFQQVKAAENLNKARRADQKMTSSEAEMTGNTTPGKRYFLASKTNSATSLHQSQQPRTSSNANQVSVLLPVDHSPRDQDKTSVLKIAAKRNWTVANSPTRSALFNQQENESDVNISCHTGDKFGRIGSNNVNPQNSVTDSRSLLLPMGNQIKSVCGAFVPNQNNTNVSVKKQSDLSIVRIAPKGKQDVFTEKIQKYTRTKESRPEADIESRIKAEHELDRDGINEAEREGNNDSEHRRSCRKRKTTVPVKNIHATARSRGTEVVEGDITSTNSVTYDPPCTEEEVSTSIDIRHVPNKRRCSSGVKNGSGESFQIIRSVEYSEEQGVLDEQKLFAAIQENIYEDASNYSTSPLKNENEILYVIKPIVDGSEETISTQSLNDDIFSNSSVQKSKDIDNIEEVLYSISKDIEEVENAGEYCENEDEQELTEEAVVEETETELNNTTCKYCLKNFDWPEELSEHMTLNHRCTECSHEFKQTSNLRKHVRIHHQHERTHECPVCLKGFPFRSALKDHIRVHEDAQENAQITMYSCDKCTKVFTRISGLRRHKKVDHSTVLAYECPKCDKRYAYRCNLNNHMMTHSALKPFTCDTCGIGFKQNSNLLKHMRTQHNKCSKCIEQCTCIARPAYECNTCGKTCGGRTQLRVHQRVHSGEKPEVCDLCGTAFQHKSNLMKHRIKHGGTKPYVCSFCTRGFYSNHSLQSHMRLHTGESPHQCDVCGKRFCTRNGLQVHSVLHGDQREFVCGTCGKAFAQLGNLNKHLAIHTGARPFPCSQCSMAFVDSSALRRHIVLHTRERNFACPTCGRTFMYLTSLRAHKLTHEEMKQHVCKICCKAFRQKAGYLRHLKIHNENGDCEEVVLKPGEYIVYLTE